MKIKSRFSGTILFESANETIKLTLQSAMQTRADLSWANLSGADLSSADLSRANLYGVNLSRADLYGANLSRANLSRANLYGANLSGADLSGANLSSADLYGADLSWANLSGADLSSADLSGADLSGADLSSANLSGADLSYFQICPKGGSFIAWKKAADGCVIQLKIPAWAMRTSSIIGRKCRAEFVVVVAIWDKNQKQIAKCTGWRKKEFAYEVGKVVAAGNYDHGPRVECSGGIHFFVTRKEAEQWN